MVRHPARLCTTTLASFPSTSSHETTKERSDGVCPGRLGVISSPCRARGKGLLLVSDEGLMLVHLFTYISRLMGVNTQFIQRLQINRSSTSSLALFQHLATQQWRFSHRHAHPASMTHCCQLLPQPQIHHGHTRRLWSTSSCFCV